MNRLKSRLSPSFRIALVAVALIFSVLPALWLFWTRAPAFEVTYHDLRSPTQTAAYRVVQLSDLHLQRFDMFEKAIVAQVQALHPDLVVLTGDSIDRADALPVFQSFLATLGPMPVVAVPGNWEHWSGVDFRNLEALLLNQPNGKFLMNQEQTFTAKGRSIHLIALDDFTAGQPDARLLSLRPFNDVSILIQHSPGFFDQPEVRQRMKDQRFSLCLSGHTHGGQITFAGWAPFRPVGSGQFVSGFYDVPGCRLFVSRGLGTSVLPFRWGSEPEIAVFDL
jgi:predicted MPP superfamily phosphohydrolase